MRPWPGPLWIALAALATLGVLAIAPAALATKAQGPFSVEARIEGKRATLTVGSHVPVRGVELQVSGTDGLEVKGAEPRGTQRVLSLRRDALAPGEPWTIAVDFTQGDGLCYLSVLVTAEGQPPVSRAFGVGELSERQKRERAAGSTVDPEGTPVKILDPDPQPALPAVPIHLDVKVGEARRAARIEVTTSVAGDAIVVKVYGLDGLKVKGGSPESALVVRTERRGKLAPGESMVFEAGFVPGPGRSILTVSAEGSGIGSVVRSIPVGRESDEQKRKRNQGVTVDPDGVPIRVMGD